MGVLTHTRTDWTPDFHHYRPEYNDDGTEKHIVCDGARFHVLSWSQRGARCSEPNCEINNGTLIAEQEAAEAQLEQPPCAECGAMTQEEAETKCLCGGDKDDCHGSRLWPD